MTETNDNTRLKFITGFLGVVLLGTLIYTISLYQNKKETIQALQQERDLMTEDLTQLKSEYDKVILESDAMNEELVTARDNIAKYIDSVQRMKTDIAALSRYRRQISVLKAERAKLLKQVDSLTQSNTLLAMQRDSTFVELERQSMFNDSLIVQNTQLANALERGSALSLSRFSVDAVREKSNGKLVSTSSAKVTDMFKVCFTIVDNGMTEAGERTFFIEVLNPQGNVLGDSFSKSNREGASLTYSKSTNFYYENSTLDVCDYIEKPFAAFQKGNYMVNVYDGNLRLLGTSKFKLR